MKELLHNKMRSDWMPLFPILIFSIAFFITNLPYGHIDIWDESIYIINSRKILVQEWSPIYSLYYRCLGLFIKDNLALHYAGYFSVSFVLFPIATYAVFKTIFTGRMIPTVFTTYLLIAQINFQVGPKIHIFNFSILAILFIISLKLKFKRKEILLFFLLGLLMHLRLENVIGILLLFFSLSLAQFKKIPIKDFFIRTLSCFLSLGLGYFLILWFNDWPIISIDKNRFFHAFKDYYIWAYNDQTKSTMTILDFDELFSQATTFYEFIYYYPSEFLSHLIINALQLRISIRESLSPLAGELSESTIILLMRTFIIFFSFSFARFKKEATPVLFFLASFSAPAIMIALVLDSQSKYLIFPSLLILISFIILMSFFRKRLKFSPSYLHFAQLITLLCLGTYQVFNKSEENLISHRNAVDHIKEFKKLKLKSSDTIYFSNFLPFYALSTNPASLIILFEYANDPKLSFIDWLNKHNVTHACFSDVYVWKNHIPKPGGYDLFEAQSKNYGFKSISETTDLIRCYKTN